MKKKKIAPVKIQKRLVDRVVSFRIEGSIVDFLINKGIDPNKSAREYLRECAKDAGYSLADEPSVGAKRRQ